jgi:hypothetical protein
MSDSTSPQFAALSPQAQALLHRMLDQQEPAANISRA